MSATHSGTLNDPKAIITDLQCQLADVRRMLDQRTAERDEALSREAATAEVLEVINSSPSDLAPVFAAMLERRRDYAKRLEVSSPPLTANFSALWPCMAGQALPGQFAQGATRPSGHMAAYHAAVIHPPRTLWVDFIAPATRVPAGSSISAAVAAC
jgi:hypothetical protein